MAPGEVEVILDCFLCFSGKRLSSGLYLGGDQTRNQDIEKNSAHYNSYMTSLMLPVYLQYLM